MATVSTVPAAARPTAVGLADRLLAIGAAIILSATIAALLRGSAFWPRIPLNIWVHIALIVVAMALTPLMLLRRRGDRLHRRLGYVWVSAMLLTALVSLDIRVINRGDFSPIHLLSIWTIIQAPLIVIRARQHDAVRHRRAVHGMVLGALLIAGFFTFPFNRLLGSMLFG